MKKILFLLAILVSSLNIFGAEEIISGYCEGRGKILDKSYDHPFLTISTTYKLCYINGIDYDDIRVDRTLRSYNKNVELGLREDYPGNSNYCVNFDHYNRSLEIYYSNADGCD